MANSIIMGAFVTLKRGEVLRGCCGVLGKPMPLGAALASAAAKTAKEDQRMAAISPSELPHLSLDVTLLGPFKRITAEGADRQHEVKVGKQGLMIQKGGKSGLLLPSVATERGWDANQFLQAVCTKAGLPIGAWQSSDASVFTFDGQSSGAQLADLLPSNLPNEVAPPMTHEQLQAYAKIAGENIVAMVTGGTPSYVITHLPDTTVNAIVLSMQWTANAGADGEGGTGKSDGELKQGNALQVSFRPGVALQSTLFQMCQTAATMFQQQRFAGQLQIGLTLGFDPSMHGYGLKADLDGVDSGRRGIVISDARHCALAFNPELTIEQLRDLLRENLPISSRDSSVHTMQVISTMPHVVSISVPTPVVSGGSRPPAVAGKFYPAEDAARRAMVATLFKGEEPPKSSPLAIMVPHAGIKYSGRVAAQVWRRLAAPEARRMVIVSPKHTAQGVNWSVCPFESWHLSNTTVISGDAQLANQIAEAVTPLQLDAAAHQNEHGIEVQLPLLERIAPKSHVVGLALNGGSWQDIQQAASEFAGFLRTLPEIPLLVISSDMNHYAPDDENRRRDRLALDAMATCDPKTLIDTCRENEISMCGVVPAAFVMETLRQLGQPFKVTQVDYATSADVTGDKTQVVGYAGALLEAC
jgi:AmmeMemoRadiSam system protein B/AmmeMemoRadiSam system protein A